MSAPGLVVDLCTYHFQRGSIGQGFKRFVARAIHFKTLSMLSKSKSTEQKLPLPSLEESHSKVSLLAPAKVNIIMTPFLPCVELTHNSVAGYTKVAVVCCWYMICRRNHVWADA
jgi:hypothetical protein